MNRLALLLSVLPLAFAFSNTSPLLAWSSRRSSVLDRLPLRGVDTQSHVLESVISGDVCFHDALILVEHPGLHASDLRNLPRSSHIAHSLSSSPSSRQFAYLSSHQDSAFDIATFAESVSHKCNSKLVYAMPGHVVEFKENNKSVIVLSSPGLNFNGASNRKSAMLENDSLLSSLLATLPFDNHLVIYTGSSSPQFKRQAELDQDGNPFPDRPVLDLSPLPASVAPKSTKVGILHHYQLLTPGLILILAIVFFLFLPVLYFGISALASIQSPLRIEVASKGFSAAEKKNQ